MIHANIFFVGQKRLDSYCVSITEIFLREVKISHKRLKIQNQGFYFMDPDPLGKMPFLLDTDAHLWYILTR